jgi:hypothetical protein
MARRDSGIYEASERDTSPFGGIIKGVLGTRHWLELHADVNELLVQRLASLKDERNPRPARVVYVHLIAGSGIV